MTPFQARMTAGFGFIVVVFIGLVAYSVRVAPQMGRDSKKALDNFYVLCRARNYEGARQMLSPRLQESITTAQLKGEWAKFAVKNGPLSRWEQADKVSINGFGGSVCVFPPFVEFRHAAFGAKGTGTLIYVRMVPQNDGWKLERFNVLRTGSL